MAIKEHSTWWLLLVLAAAIWWQLTNSDPEINFLGRGCSSVYPKDTTKFLDNLNATFSQLRSRLSENRRFATAQQVNSLEPVYAMVQCRKYLSAADCLACHAAAVSEIRNCAPAMGARVTYDGCFLRYEGYNFYKKTNENGLMCSNRGASDAFGAEGETLVRNLQVAAPRRSGYYAAGKRGVGRSRVYGVAQCVETVSKEGCQGCLTAAYETIRSCLPGAAEGRVVDGACFLRYSDTPFFGDV